MVDRFLDLAYLQLDQRQNCFAKCKTKQNEENEF